MLLMFVKKQHSVATLWIREMKLKGGQAEQRARRLWKMRYKVVWALQESFTVKENGTGPRLAQADNTPSVEFVPYFESDLRERTEWG